MSQRSLEETQSSGFFMDKLGQRRFAMAGSLAAFALMLVSCSGETDEVQATDSCRAVGLRDSDEGSLPGGYGGIDSVGVRYSLRSAPSRVISEEGTITFRDSSFYIVFSTDSKFNSESVGYLTAINPGDDVAAIVDIPSVGTVDLSMACITDLDGTPALQLPTEDTD